MTDSTGGGPPPGWFPDPAGRHEHRWWDGATWTDQVADAGLVRVDPLDAVSDAAVSTAAVSEDAVSDPAVSAGDQPGPGSYVSDQAIADAAEARRLPVGVLLAIGLAVAALAAFAVLAYGALTGDDDGQAADDGGDAVTEADPAPGDEAGDDTLDDLLGDLTDDLSDALDDFSLDLSDGPFEDFSLDLPAPDDLTLGDPVPPDEFITEYGSDSQFDALADDCFAGDLGACDRLYAITPIDDASSYEGYGATCGGRLPEEAPATCRLRG